ncbi:MAG: hypothetical protein NC092_00695 [Butyrivibrio sp.]|nr:hypothetical protein [Muribaculum sp.]MCM1551190.1 hypothetical protein [Butyrivibrio sp.]
MAIWQFDFYIIPKKDMSENLFLDTDAILNWEMKGTSIEKIDFLEKQKSWSNKISQYGNCDETCIEFGYEEDILMTIFCRLDLRSLSKKMLEDIFDYVRGIDGMVFHEGKIYYPDIGAMIELIRKSEANRFCQNPMKYIEEISQNNRENVREI